MPKEVCGKFVKRGLQDADNPVRKETGAFHSFDSRAFRKFLCETTRKNCQKNHALLFIFQR